MHSSASSSLHPSSLKRQLNRPSSCCTTATPRAWRPGIKRLKTYLRRRFLHAIL